jgi:GT2 family glycosyltransferase/glycosyltransferase involved in cell wall biosynthesis
MAIRGYVDGMQGSYISGWAVAEPDTGNCAIEIIDGQGKKIATGRASRHRADLASLGLGRTTLAFRIPVTNPAEPRMLHVFASGVELPGSPITTGAGQFEGAADVALGIVTGWVTERITGFEPPLVTVIDQHGAHVGQARAVIDPAEPDNFARVARFTITLHDRCFGAGELRLGLLANGVKFAAAFCHLTLLGNLETLSAERCSGWLLSPELPSRSFSIEVYRDGKLAGTTSCDLSREDVRGVHPECETPGFEVKLDRLVLPPMEATTISLRFPGSDRELFQGPYVIGNRAAAVTAAQRVARLAYQGLTGIGAAERAVMQMAISQFIAGARAGGDFSATCQPDAMVPFGEKPRLTIIIPVYKGIEITRDCLNSVLQHRNDKTDQLVVINDASPDALMAPMLAQLNDLPNAYVLTNGDNLGFVQSVNRGLRFAAGSDVLLLNSDTVMFAGGLDELCRVAYATAEIGTVTAMSNNATIFSYPHASLRNAALVDIGWPELAAVALAENSGVTVDVPTGHGFCMFIKNEVLRRVGLLDEAFGRGYGEENDFCARAADLGYQHVAAAGVLVEHRESTSFTDEKAALLAQNLPRLNARYPEYTPAIMAFEQQDGLRSARWALDRARLRHAAAAGMRFLLLVSNALDGGTAKAIEDIEAAAGYGGAVRMTLRSRDNGILELSCDTPLLLASFAPREIDDLFDVLAAAPPTRVLVHQLLGFPAAFIERLAGFAAKTHSVYYAHDFYPLCPRVTMIDAVGRFCDVADADTCARCVRMDGAHTLSKLDLLTPAIHRELFDDLLRGFRHVVAPSASAASYLQRGFPGLDIQVVPHPEIYTGHATGPRAGTDDEIILLGAIGPHKGSGKLLEIAQRARLTHPNLHFRVIGFTDMDKRLTAIGNVTVTGKYKPEELPGLIGQSRGRLAIFLQSWPETYSYTLSEVVRFGFIPLVPDIGAPADRVRAAGYGVVFPFPIVPEQVLNMIDDVRTGQIAAHKPGAGPENFFPSQTDLQQTKQILALTTAVTPAENISHKTAKPTRKRVPVRA